MGKAEDYLVTKNDLLIYDCLLKKEKLCQREISEKTGINEVSISRRLAKIINFKFMDKEKVAGKNQNNYSIKKEFISKIKNIIDLFEKNQ